MPDEDRDLILAHDALVCRRCGNLRSVCSDPTLDWHPHAAVCWPTATAEWGQRRLQAKHKDAKVGDDALRETDGVVIFPSLIEPSDDPLA